MGITRRRGTRLIAAAALIILGGGALADAKGWLNWRGPGQMGVSLETGLPDVWKPGGANHLWDIKLRGGGTPVISNGRLYALTYDGEGPDLQEAITCLDAGTGKKLWDRRYNDFISDTVYDRYAIGSPAIDPETGNVYFQTVAGIFGCLTPEGKTVWQHSLMETLGRLTFPNARNGCPIIEDDLVVTRYITSNWGGEGAAADRFYAFDKKTGEIVWSSTPGTVPPKDQTFARPLFTWHAGKRVFYSGDGSGNIVCANARTGEPIWRYPMSAGGINSSVVFYKNTVVAIHADENLDSSTVGGMYCVNVDAPAKPAESGTPVFEKSAEKWRNELGAISSSPVLVDDRIYQINKVGELCSVDAGTGRIVWKYKLGPDQLHASPLYADGKLYIPLHNGLFYIVKPTPTAAQELAKVQLEGRCLGAPSVWNGKIYVLTTERLYCFGKKGNGNPPPAAKEPKPAVGPAVALQVIPSEVLLSPGQHAKFRIRGIDANGFPTGWMDASKAKWVKYIPPTARVRSEMAAEFNSSGELVASDTKTASAGAFEATLDGLKGYIRGRVLPAPPISEDFETYQLTVPHATETGVKFAYPPLPWIGARFKFEVRDLDGNKVLAKTLDNIFFQRATVFIGNPEWKNYTVEADVMSDGNRRLMSMVGLINQRYLVALLGNSQELEVSSNQERVKVAVPFKWSPKTWYHLKTRVDVASDGAGVVRAKAWKKGDPEPPAWTIEVPHRHAHAEGSPGLFGFSPQSLFRVYIDNITVTPNTASTAAR